MDIAHGFCICGCGEKTNLSSKTYTKRGYLKGQPVRFVPGHNNRGTYNPSWNGGKGISTQGYLMVFHPGHPKAYDNRIAEHILIAEKTLNKELPSGAIIHHINENRNDNRNDNLVICQNRAYHSLLHRRMKALIECGHANWRKCWICGKYDAPENLGIAHRGKPIYHKNCQRLYRLAGYNIDEFRKQNPTL